MWSLIDYRKCGKPIARYDWYITDEEWRKANPYTPLNPDEPQQED